MAGCGMSRMLMVECQRSVAYGAGRPREMVVVRSRVRQKRRASEAWLGGGGG